MSLVFESHNKDKFIVRGDRTKFQKKMNKLGGRWNSTIDPPGWLIPKAAESELRKIASEADSRDEKGSRRKESRSHSRESHSRNSRSHSRSHSRSSSRRRSPTPSPKKETHRSSHDNETVDEEDIDVITLARKVNILLSEIRDIRAELRLMKKSS